MRGMLRLYVKLAIWRAKYRLQVLRYGEPATAITLRWLIENRVEETDAIEVLEAILSLETCPFCYKSFPLGGRCSCWEVGKHSCRFTERDSAMRAHICEICGAHFADRELRRLTEEREKRFSALCPDKVEPKVYQESVKLKAVRQALRERSKPASEDLRDVKDD